MAIYSLKFIYLILLIRKNISLYLCDVFPHKSMKQFILKNSRFRFYIPIIYYRAKHDEQFA